MGMSKVFGARSGHHSTSRPTGIPTATAPTTCSSNQVLTPVRGSKGPTQCHWYYVDYFYHQQASCWCRSVKLQWQARSRCRAPERLLCLCSILVEVGLWLPQPTLENRVLGCLVSPLIVWCPCPPQTTLKEGHCEKRRCHRSKAASLTELKLRGEGALNWIAASGREEEIKDSGWEEEGGKGAWDHCQSVPTWRYFQKLIQYERSWYWKRSNWKDPRVWTTNYRCFKFLWKPQTVNRRNACQHRPFRSRPSWVSCLPHCLLSWSQHPWHWETVGRVVLEW